MAKSESEELFADRYRVVELLGEGGMGRVLKCHDRELDRYVAIKVLSSETKLDAIKRFQKEAVATARLKHPNVVEVYDFGETDGAFYLVMDYLEGESLDRYLARAGTLSWEETREIGLAICAGLAHAHGQGIVHRDLKPANIMLVKNKQDGITAKIVDFGLAKILDDGMDKSQQLTQTGECFGSPLYMSPEQCLGTTVDHRADIYALGCIAYECLTGAPPIIGTTILDTFNRHLKDPPPPFPPELNVPKEWAAIIFTALAKKAEHRPASVREFKEAFKKPLHSANVPK